MVANIWEAIIITNIEPFFLTASLGGIAMAALAAPLGCIVLWRRMAYFGDALAHSALLGVVLSLILSWDLQLSIMMIAFAFALMLFIVAKKRFVSMDMTLGLLAQISIALALLLLHGFNTGRIDIMSYLFGDVLTIQMHDVWMMVAGALLIFLWFLKQWQGLLLSTLHPDLARVEGMCPDRIYMQLLIILAIVIALAIKLVGMLLISSLLLIPGAAARFISKTPEEMAIRASLISVLGMCLGLAASWHFDTPTGPTIVIALSLFLLPCRLMKTQ